MSSLTGYPKGLFTNDYFFRLETEQSFFKKRISDKGVIKEHLEKICAYFLRDRFSKGKMTFKLLALFENQWNC